MELDYTEIGRRIAQRRKKLGLKQAEAEERADISYKYLSNIERGISIPSTEVIMRLAIALDTTPDEFLVGTSRQDTDEWKNVAQMMRTMSQSQLALVRSFLTWLSEQAI